MLLTMLWCLLATFCFAVLLRAPIKAAAVASAVGAVGYGIYLFVSARLAPIAGYFFATLLISVCGEICARLMKKPATLFVSSALIPLVPGLGLYQTMSALVSGDRSAAVDAGLATMGAICVMAGAIALNTFIMRAFFAHIKK